MHRHRRKRETSWGMFWKNKSENILKQQWTNFTSSVLFNYIKTISWSSVLFNYNDYRKFAEGVIQVVLFTVLWFKWSVKKHCVAKVLLAIWESFLHENNRNYISYRLSYKFAFIIFLSFLTNQKQELGFQQVGSLVTRNIYAFCL